MGLFGRARTAGVVAGACWAALLAGGAAFAQQFHRQSFEGTQTRLRLGPTDGQVELLAHEIVADGAHSGKHAERLAVRVTSGTFALVEYPIPPTLILEDLEVSAYVSASIPGTQLHVRVVLPREIDPETGKPQVTLLGGRAYDTSNRYRNLAVSRIDKLLARQQQMLQAERGRAVDVRGAYVDQVVFNIHSGVGEYEVRIDDVVAGPLVPVPNLDSSAAAGSPAADPDRPQVPLALRAEDGAAPLAAVPEVASRRDLLRAEVRSEQLLVGNRPFFPRGMVHSHAPLRVFHETGMNLVFEPFPVSHETLAEAERLGLLLAPMLPLASTSAGALEFAAQTSAGAAYDDRAVFYYLAGPLNRRSADAVQATLAAIRQSDPRGRRPVASDVEEAVRDYSRKLDLIGTAKFPLTSSLELTDYRRWVSQRKALATPGTVFWSWIQTHPPAEFVRLAYGRGLEEGPFDLPVGPQPEQIKLATYASLAGGSRGLAFTSDRWLGESAKGRARMIQLALLNAELTLIEPFLADGAPPVVQGSSNKDVEVAVFKHRGGRGVLAIAYWKQPFSQYVVGQAADANLQFRIPGAPESAHAFEVSPAEVRGVKRSRVTGGVQVSVDEFDTAAFVVLSTDAKLYANFQELVAQTAPQTAAWRRELAEIQLAHTETTNARLEAAGRAHPRTAELLRGARNDLEECRSAADRGDHRTASILANRSMRQSRMLQRLQWEQAVPAPELATESPFAVSYFTLPEHYAFVEGLARLRFGPNRLAGGDFEGDGTLDGYGWTYEPHTPDAVRASATLTSASPKQGRRALRLAVEPLGAEAPLVLENTRVAVISPPIPVEAGQAVRIRGALRIPDPIETSVDGVMIWDSIGGESLALRFSKPCGWRDFQLLRPVRESTELRIHLVLTGLGSVEFDELVVESSGAANLPIASHPAASRK
jgi:hypothetical protein